MVNEVSPDDLMAAALRGEPTVWPAETEIGFAKAFREASEYHGARPLLAVALRGTAGKSWPPSLCALLLAEFRAQAACELIKKQELQRVLYALSASGISTVLMKGTPLAYSHYAAPALRPRGDTDLWVRQEDTETLDIVLRELGYTMPQGIGGKFASTQNSYARTDDLGVSHSLDVHWRISNTQVFARALSYDEAAEEAVPVPALGPQARALGNAHALLFACMHRIGHKTSPYYVGNKPYLGGDRLIWLYDIHLLVTHMTGEELQRFTELVARKEQRAIVFDGLQRSRTVLATHIPSGILNVLETGVPETSARLLGGGSWQKWRSDFEALDDWKERLTLAHEHLFPSPSYMMAKYGTENRLLLPALYLHRAIRGVRKTFHATKSV